MEAHWYPKQDGENDEQSPYLESLLTSESSPDFKLYFYHLSGRRATQNLFWKNPLISFPCLSSPQAPQKYLLQKIPPSTISLLAASKKPILSKSTPSPWRSLWKTLTLWFFSLPVLPGKLSILTSKPKECPPTSLYSPNELFFFPLPKITKQKLLP